MKLSTILNEARKGTFISGLKVNDASKIISNSKESMQYATTLFRKSYVSRNEGDEVVQHESKQTNITALRNIITNHRDIEMSITIGGVIYDGIIEIDC